jgi:hypothetical protein
MVVGDLVNKDTDGDGIPDWEESLYGTDPTKKETTPGIPDSVAIEKLKSEQTVGTTGQANVLSQNTGNLTKTDQFSRDFLATVTSLSQNGTIDQTTVDQISSSLANNIQNSQPRKVYTLTDVKIAKGDTYQYIKKYSDALDALDNIYQKKPAKYTVPDILQKFAGDENNVDVSALSLLDPNIKQMDDFKNDLIKTEVPQSLATLHLDVINGLERVIENLNDIKLYDTDTIVSLGAITQYYQNTTLLESAMGKLDDAINN